MSAVAFLQIPTYNNTNRARKFNLPLMALMGWNAQQPMDDLQVQEVHSAYFVCWVFPSKFWVMHGSFTWSLHSNEFLSWTLPQFEAAKLALTVVLPSLVGAPSLGKVLEYIIIKGGLGRHSDALAPPVLSGSLIRCWSKLSGWQRFSLVGITWVGANAWSIYCKWC